MMHIKKVYATSYGTFWSWEEANTKKNRAKDYCPYQMTNIHEPVRELFVLVDGDNVFELSQIEVK